MFLINKLKGGYKLYTHLFSFIVSPYKTVMKLIPQKKIKKYILTVEYKFNTDEEKSNGN